MGATVGKRALPGHGPITEVTLSPVFARITLRDGLYFKTAELANRLISEDLAKSLTRKIEKQLKQTGGF